MKVELSEDSWHYRLRNFVYHRPTKQLSLCPYFWSVVFAFVFLPLAAVGHFTKTVTTSDFEKEYGVHTGNIDYGVRACAVMIILGLAVFLASTIGYLLAILLSSSFGGIAFGSTALMLIAVTAAYKSSELWIPYLYAIKDSVCPVIYWKE